MTQVLYSFHIGYGYHLTQMPSSCWNGCWRWRRRNWQHTKYSRWSSNKLVWTSEPTQLYHYTQKVLQVGGMLVNAMKAFQTFKWHFLYYIPYHINLCLKSNLTQCVFYIKIWETMQLPTCIGKTQCTNPRIKTHTKPNGGGSNFEIISGVHVYFDEISKHCISCVKFVEDFGTWACGNL